ncbi:MAG: hypothetical protein ACREJC_09870 [Tepidisphaeraceae bacterium]
MANPRRRRRRGAARRRVGVRRARRRRGNPPFRLTIQSVTRTLIQGAQDALVVVGGELAGNLIANQIPPLVKDAAGVETQTGVLIRRALSAIGVGIAAGLVFRGNSRMAQIAVAGALASPIKTLIRPVLPTTGPFAGLLAGPRLRLSAYPMSAYPMRQLAAYPRPGLAQAPTRYGYFYGA